MAAESILVVDDVPVNLKLTDMLLRREGFRVHTSPDAEQALSLLRGFHPDLMLVDIELPGMDGLSLTREVKQNPATRDIVVVALSGRASTGDDRKALDAGCDGYITKPVDSTTLVTNIRQHLERQARTRMALPPPAPGRRPAPRATNHAAPPAEFEDLETLRRRFLDEGLLQCRQMLEALDKNFDAQKSGRLFHQWVGAAGILGYIQISDLAREAEEALGTGVLDEAYMRDLISTLILSFAEPKAAADDHVPATVRAALAGKPIGLVGFGADEAERVCAALEMVGARPMLFLPADAPDAPSVRNCGAVMVHVCPETAGTGWLAGPSGGSPQPLVLVGKRDQILALDGPVQSRASEFLIDGWQPEEALMRLSFALSRTPRAGSQASRPSADSEPEVRAVTGTPEILIADDDPTVRSLVRLTLQEYGMECRVATNGSEALQMVRDHTPHAAVLDVNMPGMDGYLVLAAIREEKLPVRVVLLTARKHENDISRGFTLGADDYLVKPFNGVELVARLKRLLRR